MENNQVNETRRTLSDKRMDDLFNPKATTISVCVGSWNAYNACNEHALGTCWRGHYFIDFTELDGAEELDAVLNTLGWTEAEKEELFVQDYESDCLTLGNCDFEDPRDLADFVQNHLDALMDEGQLVKAVIDIHGLGYEEAVKAVEDGYYYLRTDCDDASDYAYYYMEETGSLEGVPEWITRYIDYEAMGRDMMANGEIDETPYGILVNCR